MNEKYMKQIQMYISKTLSHPIDNETLIKLYYQIGSYLRIYNFAQKDLKCLEWKLQEVYGIVIGFTKRNFIWMIQFSKVYSLLDLNNLKQVSWHQILKQLKQKKRKTIIPLNQLEGGNGMKHNYVLKELQEIQKKRMKVE